MDAPLEGLDVPAAFKGVSGAGVWQVLVRKSAAVVIYARPQDYLLSNVAFYEWFAPTRRLRSHGRRSIYERVFDAAWSA